MTECGPGETSGETFRGEVVPVVDRFTIAQSHTRRLQ
jgi:hypothetical protein